MAGPGRDPSAAVASEVRVRPPGKARGHGDLLDRTFDISVGLKGLDGVLELAGGILLLVVSPAAINRLAVRLTQHELSQDPHDFLALHLLHVTANLHKTQLFGGVYLLSHGLVKVVLVVALLRRQRWAYPAALVFLGGFVVYQLYRLTYAPTIGLSLLTVFDLFIIWLVWREYRRIRHPPTPATPSGRADEHRGGRGGTAV